MESFNPCISCGACCAFYRATFYWGECSDGFGKVPVELTEDITPHRRVMKGTNSNTPRCIALNGEIGNCVSCSIYEVRSTVCREFPYSWQDGIHNERCDQARAAYGLAPLLPFDNEKAA
jgi:Fe-S-cluster containining protein